MDFKNPIKLNCNIIPEIFLPLPFSRDVSCVFCQFDLTGLILNILVGILLVKIYMKSPLVAQQMKDLALVTAVALVTSVAQVGLLAWELLHAAHVAHINK